MILKDWEMHGKTNTYGGQPTQSGGQSNKNGGMLPKESGTTIREDKLANAAQRGGK